MKLDARTLAINGGTPVRPHGKKWLDNITTGVEEKEALARVIDSGYLSLYEGSHTPDEPFSFIGGPEVQALEKEWAHLYGTKHAIAMNSATSGLYAAIAALGIGYGDEVIVSPYTMTACALAPLIYGAIPVFADVLGTTGSLDPASIKQKISPNTKAIIVVHQFGIPADMIAINEIAREFGIKVIEDCAQAHGAKVGNFFVGSLGDIGVFSLNVNKTIQAGEGAVCTTNDDDLAYRLQLVRNHGEAVVGPAGYQNITNIAGYNYRLTELGAAVARVQLLKLSGLNGQRLKMVDHFKSGIRGLDFISPLEDHSSNHSTYYIMPFRFHENIAKVSRSEFISAVNAEGAMFYQGYVKPLYFQPLYQKKHLFKGGYPFSAPLNRNLRMEYGEGTCPIAEKLHFKEIVINEHVRLPNTMEDIDDLLSCIYKVAGV